MKIYVLWTMEDKGIWKCTPYRADDERELLRWIGEQRQLEGKFKCPIRIVCRRLEDSIVSEEEI